MNCGEVRERLSEYLDGELAPLERSELASHIERCPSCASELQAIEKTVELVNSLPRLSAPPELARELKRKISTSTAVFTRRVFALAGAAAVILIALVLLFNLLTEGEPPVSEVRRVATGSESATPDALLARAELEKKLAESDKTPLLADALLKEEEQEKLDKLADSSGIDRRAKEFLGFAGQGTQTVERARRAGATSAEVVEKEIAITTSDLKGTLDKIDSFLAQISPEEGLAQWKITRQVSEDGAITLMIDCATETRYQQLVEKVSRLKASLDSRAPDQAEPVAGAKSAEDLAKDKEAESRGIARALKEEKAKDKILEPEGAEVPPALAAEPAEERRRAEQLAGEPPQEAQKAGLPQRVQKKLAKEGAAGQSQMALQKAQEQAVTAGGVQKEEEKEEVPERYIVRVKLIVVDTK